MYERFSNSILVADKKLLAPSSEQDGEVFYYVNKKSVFTVKFSSYINKHSKKLLKNLNCTYFVIVRSAIFTVSLVVKVTVNY